MLHQRLLRNDPESRFQGRLTHDQKRVSHCAAGLVIAACGEVETAFDAAKHEATVLGRQALQSSADVVDTRTGRLLAGQSEAFCGCIAERLGAWIEPDHIEAFRQTIGATIADASMPIETDDQTASATRQKMAACAAHATIAGAATAMGN